MTFKNFEGGKNGLRTFCFKFLLSKIWKLCRKCNTSYKYKNVLWKFHIFIKLRYKNLVRGFQFQDLQYSWTLGVSETGTICAKLHHLQLPTPSSSCMAAWLMPKIHLRIPLLPSALNSRGETKECKGKARHFNGRQILKESLEPWTKAGRTTPTLLARLFISST